MWHYIPYSKNTQFFPKNMKGPNNPQDGPWQCRSCGEWHINPLCRNCRRCKAPRDPPQVIVPPRTQKPKPW
eukprot:15310528-Alexandrium_andersonii.AAC.1